MKRKLPQIILFLFVCLTSRAYDFGNGGLMYNIIDDETTTNVTEIEVTYVVQGDENANYYTGDIVIPGAFIKDGTPYKVVGIGVSAFEGCSGLTSVIIPNSVTTIGARAFRKCSGLTSMEIPNGITSISGFTFSGCSGLTSVIIPNNVTTIGASAFNGCSSLTSVEIPNSVTTIGASAFNSCSSLTFVKIPNGVTAIQSTAFYGCNNITSVVSEIEEPFYYGAEAFLNIAPTCTLTIPAGTRDAYIAAGWTEDVFKGGVVEAIKFADANVKAICVANWDTNEDGELDKNEAADVTDLGEVFKENTNITSFDELQYFTGLTSISSSALSEQGTFNRCSRLTSVTIPNSVTFIGNLAFQNCINLTSVTIPNSVTAIAHGAFFNCRGLTSVELPNSVTSIGSSAFGECSGLTSVTIPNSVTSIGESAFIRCSGLTSVEIPNSITSIGQLAFYCCSSLTSVTIPNSVTSIALWAFGKCEGLTSVTIPNSVTTIGNLAFSGCSGLTSVVSEIEEPFAFGSDAFSDIPSICTLTIPAGTRDAYIAAGWTEEVFKGGIIDPMEMATFDTAKEYVLQNKQNSLYMTLSEEGVTLSETPHALQFEEAENGLYYLTDGTYYVGLAGTNDWTMSSAADNKEGLAIYPTLVNDVSYFTLRQSKGLVGVDYPIKENLKCWANKTMSDGDAVLWSISSGEQEEIPADTDVSTLANAIYIESTEGFIGTSISLPVKMKNDLTPVGCSFRLTLPEGLTLLTDTDGDIVYELGNRAKKMSLTYKDWNNGTYDFALSPTTASATINGTEGVFITFHMTVPDDMAEGDRKVKLTKNLIQTMEGSVTKENELTDVVSTISINNYIPGDVNGDRNVSPADAIMILYHYFEVVQNGFNKKAADMNGDGNISPADAIEVLYKYFSAGSANATPRLTPTLDPQ